MRLAIIADDLTGAADAAAPFAARGFQTVIAFGDGRLSDADVVAISTESRHLPTSRAGALAHEAARRFAPAEGDDASPTIFKKIDSTLRGQISAELGAVMDVLGADRALVAPAFPAQGRTTQRGRQLLQGAPLERTEFAPAVMTSDLVELLAAGPRRQVHHLSLDVVRGDPAQLSAALDRSGITIPDAERDADLIALAAAASARGIGLLCGSAGLARALAFVWGPATRGTRADPPQLRGGPILVVAASRHPQTRRQIDRLIESGAALVAPSPEQLASGAGIHEQVAGSIARAHRRGDHVVLAVGGAFDSESDQHRIAVGLGRIARFVVEQAQPGGLVLTGGDGATAVLGALGVSRLRLCGEVEGGISWGMSHGEARMPLPIVTKAGGFGHDDSLCLAVEHLARLSSVA